MKVRLHKHMADLGVASRRKCEEYIRNGLVKVNGSIVREMGVSIDPEVDTIELDPALKQSQKATFVYYALHKPVGYVCTGAESEGMKVTDLIDEKQRIFTVGRLDKLTSGLIIVTNDGRLTYKLTHPKFEKEKEYVVKVREKITSAHLDKLTETFYIQGKKTRAPIVKQQSPHLLNIILFEGRNRQIRRMCERAELHIEKLKRIRMGDIHLGYLQTGEYRKLTSQEQVALGI